MTNTRSCWLILEKSDGTRISKGIDGYRDRTGESYNFDSLVPNHKNVKAGDIAIIRKEDEILGYGEFSEISSTSAMKIHRRCPDPNCDSTDIRERKTKVPTWKCGHCSIEFDSPVETETPVISFNAAISGFTRFKNAPAVKAVKACAVKGDGVSAQLSILQLDYEKVRALMEGVDIEPPKAANTNQKDAEQGSKAQGKGQGIGLSQEERKAIEDRAMKVTHDLYFKAGWVLVDTSTSMPYDYQGTKGDEVRFIEVKGTTGPGESVILTRNEVSHARANSGESALVVVSHISLVSKDGKWIASGGVISTHRDPWCPEEDRLEALEYRYQV